MKFSKWTKALLVLAAATAGLTSIAPPASAFYGMGGLLGTGLFRGGHSTGYDYGSYSNGYGGYASPVSYDWGGAYVSPVGFTTGCGPCGVGLNGFYGGLLDQPYEFFRH